MVPPLACRTVWRAILLMQQETQRWRLLVHHYHLLRFFSMEHMLGGQTSVITQACGQFPVCQASQAGLSPRAVQDRYPDR